MNTKRIQHVHGKKPQVLWTAKRSRSVDWHSKLVVLLSDRAVADMIKRRARAAGLEYTEFSDHSLRTGLVMVAALPVA